MNILIIGKFYTEGFGLHIAETLLAMGHTVQRFEPGYKAGRIPGRAGKRFDQVLGAIHVTTDSLPKLRAWRMAELWRVVDSLPLDVVIVCKDFLWPVEVAELKRRSGASIAMWFPDAIVNIHRGLFMNADYDALFFKDPFIVNQMGDVLSSPVYYLPECFNPCRHKLPDDFNQDDSVYRCDIATAGNYHSWRVAVYKHLAEFDVKLWGNPPPLWMPKSSVQAMYQGRGVYNDQKAMAFRGARIVVNNLHYGEIWGLSVRCFEAAGVGAFQMVDWRPGLGQLFDDGNELITYKSISDLRNKIVYWLPRDEERRSISEAGQRRAQAEHTYQHRLELLLETLGGRAKGYPMPSIGF